METVKFAQENGNYYRCNRVDGDRSGIYIRSEDHLRETARLLRIEAAGLAILEMIREIDPKTEERSKKLLRFVAEIGGDGE